VAKWLEERIQDNVLSVLLVINPTEDLSGAEAEGNRLRTLLSGQPGYRLKEIRGHEATRPALLSAFSSGEFDIIHYAGHAEFNESAPERSGLVCANGVRLTGADLAGLGNLPTLVFFNACEAGRIRGKVTTKKTIPLKSRLQHIPKGVGLAEAFMRGGVANFISTYWPVGDAAAETFAASFYSDLILGKALGETVRNGRILLKDQKFADWANYTFYGNADFVLKEIENPVIPG
jgi:CHAT domain-containing protein